MQLLKNRTTRFMLAGIILALFCLVLSQAVYVETAHSSFYNYYAFRGCDTLLTKTDSDATCALANGKVIKIVLYRGKWYLDGDLPNCFKNFCF